MSELNAGVVRGRLELEDEFGDTLRDFSKQLNAAKTDARDTSRAVQSIDEEMDDFRKSVHESAASLEGWAREQVDAEEAARATGRAVETEANAVRDVKDEMKQTAPAVEKLATEEKQLAAETRKASADMERQRKEVGSMKSEFTVFKNLVGNFGAMFGAQFLVQPIVNFAKEVVAMGSEIKDMSDRMGVGVEDAQALKYAITQTGGSFNDATTAISKLNDNLTEGKKGTAAALKSIGLELNTLRAMDPGAAFTAIAEAIKDVPDPMQQTQIAMELFGKSGVKWLPAIRAGMTDLKQEAKDLGQVMSKENVEALDRFGDMYDQTMTRLKVATVNTALVITDAFKSSWTEITKDFISKIQSMGAGGSLSATALGTAFASTLVNQAYQNNKQSKGATGDWGDPQAKGPIAPSADELAKQQRAAEQAANAIKEYAKKVSDAVDTITGREAQNQLKFLRDQWKQLTAEQKNNKVMVQSFLEPYEQMRGKLQKLPKDIEAIRNEMGKRLPSNNLLTSFNGDLIQLTKAIDVTKVESVNVTNLLQGLRSDGLLPVTKSFIGYAEAIDVANIKQTVLREGLPKVRDAMNEAFDEGFGQQLAGSIVAGFESGGFKGAMFNAARTAVDAFSGAITQQASGKLGGVGGGIVGGLSGAILSYATSEIIDMLDDSDIRAAKLQTKQMYAEILGQFGGSERNLNRGLSRAGLSQRSRNAITGLGGSTDKPWGESQEDVPIQLAEHWQDATAAINQYNKELTGLSSVLAGAEKVGARMFKSFEDSIAAQNKALPPLEEGQKRVYVATEQQIQSFNRLGTIAGGAIANIAGRTGDLYGAFMEGQPLLDQLLQAKADFGLKDQLSAATTEVLRMYEQFKNNQDVYTSIQGIGQVLSGLGESIAPNVELVNALGNELEANALTLESRGVSVTEIYASMAPQLQALWETVKDGKLVVDDTTAALLAEAEAQGVVGESMRSVNEQILNVLKEIKAMFQDEMPSAIARTATANQEGATASQRAWTEAQNKVKDDAAKTGAQQRREADETSRHIKGRIGDLTKEKWYIPMEWKVPDPPDLPEIPKQYIELEYNGRPMGEGEGPRTPDSFPDPSTLPPPRNPASAVDGANSAQRENGNTTVVFEDAGRAFLSFTAENLPGYVRVRGGTSVEAI